MTYAAMVPLVRECLGVGTGHDASILEGISRNVRYLLRNYNFPLALKKGVGTLVQGSKAIILPADCGKIKGVRLWYQEADGSNLYKVLQRREETTLPYQDGPAVYYRQAENLVLDTAMPEAGYKLEVWYQTNMPSEVESWMSEEFSDVLLHRTVYELAPMKNKPDVQQIYGSFWQEDMQVLAIYLQELEWGGMDLRMGPPETKLSVARYPSS